MKIELSQQEAQVLVNLLDLAVKAGGLNVAGAALGIIERIKAAEQDVPPPPKLE